MKIPSRCDATVRRSTVASEILRAFARKVSISSCSLRCVRPFMRFAVYLVLKNGLSTHWEGPVTPTKSG